ncbi:MAG: GNAT family N-acetyltransferase [Actinomycetales bacterium]|nr:GNAT family N-acetyltransferase [Actinomycetales bacterium]
MTVVIRRALAAEAPDLAAIAALTFPLACPPSTTAEAIREFIDTHLSAAAFARYLVDPSRMLFVADDAGRLLGYTMLVAGEPADPDVAAAITARPTIELSKCYAHPDAHGTGLAGELVAASVAEARAAGAAGVWLGVNQENARANRFYEKQGFALVGEKHFLVGDELHDDFVRELVL